MTMSESNAKQAEENIKTGQQGTHEPWKRSGQSSQDPAQKPPEPRPRRDTDNSTA
jgi:hypothetical protein